MSDEMKKRLKNPAFLLAVASILYKVISEYWNIDLEEYKMYVDLIAYVFMGWGIYSVFTPAEEKKAAKKAKARKKLQLPPDA